MVKYSIDDGATWLKATNGVRVLVEELDVCGEETLGLMELNLTHEGLITDVWVSREEKLDHNIATSSITYEELANKMVEEDA